MFNNSEPKKNLPFIIAIFQWILEVDYVVLLGKVVRAGIRGLFTWKGGGFVRTQLQELRQVDFANVRRIIKEDINLLRGPNGWQAFQEKHDFDLELNYREIHDEYVRLANKAAKSKTYKRLLKPITLVNDLQDLYHAVRHQQKVDRFLHQSENKIEDVLFDEKHNEFPETQNELILFENPSGSEDYTEKDFLSKKEAANINAYGLSLTQTFQTIEDLLASFDKTRKRPELNAWQVNFLESLNLYALGRMSQLQVFQKPVPRYLTFRALTSNPFFASRSKVGLLETKDQEKAEIIPRNKLLRAFHLRLSPDASLNRKGESILDEEIATDAPFYDSEKREWNSEEAATVGDLLDYVLRLNSSKAYRPHLRIRRVTGGWKERDISPRYVLVSTTAARMEDLDLSKYLNSNRIMNRKPFNQDLAIFHNNSTLASPLSNLYQNPSYYNQEALFMDPLYCLDFRDAFGSFVLTDEPQNPALQLASSEERVEPEDLPRLLTQQVPFDRLFSREEAAHLSALYLQKPIPAWKKEFQLQSKSFWQELQAKKEQEQGKKISGNPLFFLRAQPSLYARRSRWLEEKRKDLQMELTVNILERQYLEPKLLEALENLMETAKGVIQQAGKPKEKTVPLFSQFLDYIDFDSELMALHQEYHSLVDQDLELEKALKSLGELSSHSSMAWSDLKDMNVHYLNKEQRPRGQNLEQGWDKEWLEQKLARIKNHQKRMVANRLEDQWTRFLIRDLPQTLWSELRELQEELMQTDIGKTWAQKLFPYDYNPETFKKILEQKLELWEVKDLIQEMFAYLTTDLLQEAKMQAKQSKLGENPKVQSFLAQKESFKKKMQASPKYASVKKKVRDFLQAYESTFKRPKGMEFPLYQTEKDLDNLMVDLIPSLEKNPEDEEKIRPFLKKGAKFTDFAGYFKPSTGVDSRTEFDPTTDERRALPLNLFSDDSELFFNWYCQISWKNWERKARLLDEQISRASKMSKSSPIDWPFSEGSFQKEKGPVLSRHTDQALIQQCKHSLKNLLKEQGRHSKELKKAKEALEVVQMELQLWLFRQLNLLKEIQDQKEIRSWMDEFHIVQEVQPVKTLRKTSRSLLKKFQRKNVQLVTQKKERFVAAAPYLEFLMKKQEEWKEVVDIQEEKNQQLQETILTLKEYKSTLQSMERARTFQALQKKTHTQELVQQWKAAKKEFRTKKEDFLAHWRRKLDDQSLPVSEMSMDSVDYALLQEALIQDDLMEAANRKAAEDHKMAEEGQSKVNLKGGWFSNSGFVAQAAESNGSTQSDSGLTEVLAQHGLIDLRLGEDPALGKKQEGYFEKKERLQKEQAEFEAFLYKDKPWWKGLKAKEAHEVRVKGLSTESLSYPLAIGSKTNKKARKPIHFYLLKNSQGQVQPMLPVETTEKQARDLWFQLKATNPLFKDLGTEPRFIQIDVDEFLERTHHLDFKEIKTLTLKNHEF